MPYRVATSIALEFPSDGERVVISPDRSEQDWLALPGEKGLKWTTATEQNVTRLSSGGAIVGAPVSGEMQGLFDIYLPHSDGSRNGAALQRLDAIVERACYEDLYVVWTEEDGVERRVLARTSDDSVLQDTRGPQKAYTMSLVSESPYVESLLSHVIEVPAGQTLNAFNLGGGRSFPVLRVYGGFTQATITNEQTGELFRINRAVAPGDFVLVDCRPGRRGAWLNGSEDVYADTDFLASSFFSINGRQVGQNKTLVPVSLQVAGSSGAPYVRVSWRSTWRAK